MRPHALYGQNAAFYAKGHVVYL